MTLILLMPSSKVATTSRVGRSRPGIWFGWAPSATKPTYTIVLDQIRTGDCTRDCRICQWPIKTVILLEFAVDLRRPIISYATLVAYIGRRRHSWYDAYRITAPHSVARQQLSHRLALQVQMNLTATPPSKSPFVRYNYTSGIRAPQYVFGRFSPRLHADPRRQLPAADHLPRGRHGKGDFDVANFLAGLNRVGVTVFVRRGQPAYCASSFRPRPSGTQWKVAQRSGTGADSVQANVADAAGSVCAAQSQANVSGFETSAC